MTEVKEERGGLKGLDEPLSAATALIGLYERRANSAARNQDELGVVQREMKVIKAEILSALARLSKRLQVLQDEPNVVKSVGFSGQH